MTLDEIAKETWEGIYKSTKPFGPLAIKQACLEYARSIIPEKRLETGGPFTGDPLVGIHNQLRTQMLSRIEEDSK